MKIKAFTSKRIGRYLLYALGEVILVVVGILIALQINNRNEESKQQKELKGILKNVSYDLKTDTTLIGNAVKYYEARKKVAQDILNDKYDLKALSSCFLCKNMLTNFFPVTINDKGYTQLKNFNEGSSQRDSLVVDIVQFYNAFSSILDKIGNQVEDNSLENIRIWREKEPWFADAISGKNSEGFNEYMTTQDYKNRVAYYNTIAVINYLGILQIYKANAEEVLRRIDKRYPDLEPD